MCRPWITAVFLWMLAFGADAAAAEAGDSFYGTVTEVRRADLIVFDYGGGSWVVHLIGISPPSDSSFANAARSFAARLVLGKHARIRLEGRRNGQLYARVLTADSTVVLNQDLAVELVRAGLATRQPGFDYKYGDLSDAEQQASRARRGLWASQRNR